MGSGWRVDVLVQGYPGKSKEQGGLGWSTIGLARGHGRVVLLDTGRVGVRKVLLDRLKAAGIAPADVTDVLLTHLHYDHCENWAMFPNATLYAPGRELNYALALPDGSPMWSEHCLRALAASPRLRRIGEGPVGLPGVTCFEAPGHSPQHLAFVLEGSPVTLFSSDVAKNLSEVVTGEADSTMDAQLHAASIARLVREWRAREGAVLLVGHDLPMRLDAAGRPERMGAQRNALEAYLGTSLAEVTRFPLG
jgi:glyoxylase-like metal-dependent hydrolase (beta-lactamase superfamily II)